MILRKLEKKLSTASLKQFVCWMLGCMCIFSFIVLTFGTALSSSTPHFAYLADAFLHGHTYFSPEHIPNISYLFQGSPFLLDMIQFGGHSYWPAGPFPAVLLLPFVVLFGTTFNSGYLVFCALLIDLFILYKIAKKIGLRSSDSLFLATFFLFGTSNIALFTNAGAWYFSQILSMTLLLVGVYVVVYKKHYAALITGVLVACAIATRSNLILASGFFLFVFFTERKSWRSFAKQCAAFCLPIFVVGCLILVYNFVRFGDPLETGYTLSNITPAFLPALHIGLFSVVHFPANLFVLIFRGPDPVIMSGQTYVLQFPYIVPNIWGMGIFFTSPVLIYIFRAPWKDKIVQAATLATGLILVSLLFYYAPGSPQFGYRYASDFLPFLYLLLCKALLPRLSWQAKFLILFGIAFDWYMFLNMSSFDINAFAHLPF